MVKKKRSRKTTKRAVRKTGSISKLINTKNKPARVINNLLLFVALSLVSFVLYRFVQNVFFNNLFLIMAIIFGFISVGFLITFLILIIIKSVSKR